MRSKRGTEHGFTIIELAVVIAMVAILAVSVGPAFFDGADISADLFFDDTFAAVRYAQKLAVAANCNVQVTVSSSSYTLNLQDGCSGSTYTTPAPDPATGAAGYTNTAPLGVVLSSTISPFLFDAQGRALDPNGTTTNATITVDGEGFNVIGETGLVYVP